MCDMWSYSGSLNFGREGNFLIFFLLYFLGVSLFFVLRWAFLEGLGFGCLVFCGVFLFVCFY